MGPVEIGIFFYAIVRFIDTIVRFIKIGRIIGITRFTEINVAAEIVILASAVEVILRRMMDHCKSGVLVPFTFSDATRQPDCRRVILRPLQRKHSCM